MLKFLIISLLVALSKSEDPQKTVVKVPVVPFNPNSTLVIKDGSRAGRISGGQWAYLEGTYPFVVEINVFTSATSYSLCTGAFLSRTWALTALHCVGPGDHEWWPIYVKYGSASRASSQRQTIGVDKYVWWPDSNARTDFVVLHFPTETVNSAYYFGEVIQLPPLSMENSFYDGYTAINAGFGAFKDLQYQSLKLDSRAPGCPPLDGYEKWGICAQSASGTSTAEGGDSGSPIFIHGVSPTIVGVLWGGTSQNHLGTRISAFIRTISDVCGLSLRN